MSDGEALWAIANRIEAASASLTGQLSRAADALENILKLMLELREAERKANEWRPSWENKR